MGVAFAGQSHNVLGGFHILLACELSVGFAKVHVCEGCAMDYGVETETREGISLLLYGDINFVRLSPWDGAFMGKVSKTYFVPR